jgi:hypothetical protein
MKSYGRALQVRLSGIDRQGLVLLGHRLRDRAGRLRKLLFSANRSQRRTAVLALQRTSARGRCADRCAWRDAALRRQRAANVDTGPRPAGHGRPFISRAGIGRSFRRDARRAAARVPKSGTNVCATARSRAASQS